VEFAAWAFMENEAARLQINIVNNGMVFMLLREGIVEFREKFMRRFASGRAQFLKRTIFDLRDSFGNFFHVSRFAAFAAKWNRREIRTIRFQHEFVHRRGGDAIADILRALERDNSGETDERADFKNLFHAFHRFAEAMKNAANFSGERLELRESVVK
jgi:hypothetical protein